MPTTLLPWVLLFAAGCGSVEKEDGGGDSDADSDGDSDADTDTDTGTSSLGRVDCAGSECDADKICCIETVSAVESCIPSTMACTNLEECDSQSDCASGVCCQNDEGLGTSCQDGCDAGRVCEGAEECAGMLTCCPVGPGGSPIYGVCQDACAL